MDNPLHNIQDVTRMHIGLLGDVHDVFWASRVRSIYVLYLGVVRFCKYDWPETLKSFSQNFAVDEKNFWLTDCIVVNYNKSVLVPLATESIPKHFKKLETTHEIDLGNEKKILTGINIYHDPSYYNDMKNIKIYVYSRVGFNEFDYIDYEDIMLDWKGVR